MQEASRVSAGMGGAKEYDANSRLEDMEKVSLAEPTSPCSPQHLLNNNATKAVNNE